MATNNMAGQARSAAPAAKGLLGGLVIGAEHMMALGCLGLIVVLVACGVVSWYTITSWTTPTDPAQTTVILRRGETEHSSLDRCPAGRSQFFTARGMVCR